MDVTLYLIFGALCYATGLYIGKHWNKYVKSKQPIKRKENTKNYGKE